MKKKNFFSIIIPAHNEEKIIEESLTYLKDLTYPQDKYEVIVIENGSTDNTYKLALKFKSSNIKVFSSKEKGVSRARNLGVSKISLNSDWIILLDADTFLKKEFLNELNTYFEKYPKVTFGTSYITPYPNTLKHRICHYYVNYGDYLFKYLHRIHIVKKTHLKDLVYDVNVASTEDLILSRNLRKKGGKYFFIHSKNVLNSTRRWDSEGYIKPYLISFYHTVLNKDSLKKKDWKIIR